MSTKKELVLIHKDTLSVISKIIEVSKTVWHNTVDGVMVEEMTTEEVYQLVYCSKKLNFYVCGSM